MILSVSDQALLFLSTAVIGFVLAFFYDWIRIFRRIIPHHDWLTYAEDILYWLMVSVFVFVVLLEKNYGEIRFFSIAGVLIGMILYFFTLSSLFLSVSMTIINFIKRVILFIVRIVLAPFRLLLKLLSYPYAFFKKIITKKTDSTRRHIRQIRVISKHKAGTFKKNMEIILKKH